MAKQVCDIKSTKGIAAADSKEQTRSWTPKQMEMRLANKDLNYDFTRSHLNFEIVDGKVKEVDKEKLLDDSIRDNLERRGIPHPDDSKSHVKKGAKEPEKMVRNIAARMILGGSTDRMNEIAFGNQEVDFRKGAQNPNVTRSKEIEEWAKQEYAYLENMYGKGCVARFIVHLDESWVHAHATVIPTAIIKGKERVSWRIVFGGSLDVSRPKWKRILDEHYNQVGKNWGLDRGDPIAITGAKHRSTRDYNKDLKKENAELLQENASLTTDVANLTTEKEMLLREKDELQQQYEGLQQNHQQLSCEHTTLVTEHSTLAAEHASLIKQTDKAKEDLAAIFSRAEQLTTEMGKNMKAMKSLTSMIENKMMARADAIQDLYTAQAKLDSGEITAEQYETIMAETNAKVDEFDVFIKGKTDSLTTVGTQLMEKQSELEQLHTDYDSLLAEVDAAKQFKKENGGLWKRMASYIDNTMTERALLDVARRLNAIPEGAKVEGLSELAKVLKTFADGYPEQLKKAKQSGYNLGYKARNTEIQPDEERLRSAVTSLGAQQTQNMNLSALITWLEELARRREAALKAAKAEGKAEGHKEAIKEIGIASGRNWPDDKIPTPEKLGKWYKGYRDDSLRLKEFEKRNGSLSTISNTIDGYTKKVKQRDDKICLLRSLMPTLDQAIKAIISLFHDARSKLTVTMDQAEHIWRILSMASTQEECTNLANHLVELAKSEDSKSENDAWIECAAQCVFEIAENVNPLAAIFNLLPDGHVSVGGGGGNNDLPRKKDDDDLRNRFNAIMGYSRGNKGTLKVGGR